MPEIEALAVSEQQLSLSFAENLGAAGLVGEQLSLELVPAVEAAGTGLAAFTTDVGAAGLGLMALGPTAALAVLSAASLKDGWNQAKETLDNVIGTAEQIPGVFKAVADSGGIVGTVATDVKSAWSGLLSVFEQYNTYSLAAQGINKITDAVDVLIGVVSQASVLTSAMNAELSKLQNSGVSAAVAEVSGDLTTLNDSVHKATDQQTLLNQVLTDAQTKFQAISAQYQSGAATAEQYIAAQKSVETATENLTKAQDAQTNAAMNAAIEQAKLDQETQVAIETATQYLDTVSKMPEVQQQELSALQETASVLPPLVAQFAGLDGVISNLQSTMPGFGVQILNLTSGPLAGLQNALAQAAQNVTEWAARMADGENVGVQYEKALQRQLAAQVALDQETAVLNTGLQGATDTISLAKDAVAAAQAKVDDLTQAFQSGLTTYDKVQQAQKQLTSAQTELNKVTGDGKGFVDQLSAAYPQLGSSCDNATGAIGRQTTALQQDAAALQSVASAVQQVESDMAAAFSTQSTSGGTVNVGQGLQLGGGLLTGGGEFGTRQYSYGVYGDASTVAAQAKQQEQLRYDQGYTPEAIAKAMGVPLSQVLTDLGLTAGQAEQAKSQGGVVLSPNQPTSPITTSAGSIPPPGGSSSGGGSTSSPVVSAGGGGTSAIDGGSYPAVTAHQASGEVWAVSGSGVSTSGGGVAGAPITTTVQTTLNQTNSADLSGVTNVVGQVAQQISGFSGGLLPITQNLANIANSLGQVATRVSLGPLSTSGDSSGLPGVVGGSGRVYGGTPLPIEVGGGNPQGPYVPPPASTPPSAPPGYNPFGQTSVPINAQVSIDMRGANVGAQTQSALTQAVTQGLVNALRTAGARF